MGRKKKKVSMSDDDGFSHRTFTVMRPSEEAGPIIEGASEDGTEDITENVKEIPPPTSSPAEPVPPTPTPPPPPPIATASIPTYSSRSPSPAIQQSYAPPPLMEPIYGRQEEVTERQQRLERQKGQTDRGAEERVQDQDHDHGQEPSKSKEGKKASGCFGFCKFLCSIILMALAFVGVVVLCVGIMLSLERDLLAADSSMHVVQAVLLTFGILVTSIALLGLIALMGESRGMAIAFVVLTILLLAGHGYAAFKIQSNLDASQQNLSNNWGKLENRGKNFIQLYASCCGFDRPDDRPGDKCLSDVVVGCSSKFKQGFDYLGKFSVATFYGSVAFWVLLSIMLLLVIFVCAGRQPRDNSNV